MVATPVLVTAGISWRTVRSVAGCRFDFGWDQRLIDEYEKVRECAPRAVLSTYPPAISAMGLPDNQKQSMATPRWVAPSAIRRLQIRATIKRPCASYGGAPQADSEGMASASGAGAWLQLQPAPPHISQCQHVRVRMERLWQEIILASSAEGRRGRQMHLKCGVSYFCCYAKRSACRPTTRLSFAIHSRGLQRKAQVHGRDCGRNVAAVISAARLQSQR